MSCDDAMSNAIAVELAIEKARAARKAAAEARAAEVKLSICTRCGWYDGLTHAGRCDPAAGKAADRLADALYAVPSTKLGYGDGCLTFEFDENKSITLRVDGDGTYAVDHIHWIGHFKVSAMSSLINALFEQRAWTDPDQGGF